MFLALLEIQLWKTHVRPIFSSSNPDWMEIEWPADWSTCINATRSGLSWARDKFSYIRIWIKGFATCNVTDGNLDDSHSCESSCLSVCIRNTTKYNIYLGRLSINMQLLRKTRPLVRPFSPTQVTNRLNCIRPALFDCRCNPGWLDSGQIFCLSKNHWTSASLQI